MRLIRDESNSEVNKALALQIGWNILDGERFHLMIFFCSFRFLSIWKTSQSEWKFLHVIFEKKKSNPSSLSTFVDGATGKGMSALKCDNLIFKMSISLMNILIWKQTLFSNIRFSCNERWIDMSFNFLILNWSNLESHFHSEFPVATKFLN